MSRPKFRALTINDKGHRQRVVDALKEVAIVECCVTRGVKLDLIRPGKPTENGMIESFTGPLRDPCLDVNDWATLRP